MKLKKINIKNYGSILNFDYKFRYDDEGNPIPLVLIGQNGSGKSLVVANIVDALVEIKRNLYNSIPEVKDKKYFKVGKKTYINKNNYFSLVNIDFSYGEDKELKYFDLMSYDVEKLKTEHPDIIKLVANRSEFEENGFSRNIKNLLKEKEFIQDCYVYFPVDRYYIPNWFNEENYQRLNYDDDNRLVGKSSQNLIKTNVLLNIKRWLYDIFLSRKYQLINTTEGIFSVPFNDAFSGSILSLLRTIKEDASINIPQYSYKSSELPISGNRLNIKDLNNVSSGEAMLISIFLSLIKEYDFNHNNFELKDIQGICIIDEIDLNLHIKQQKEILPKLIKMFPKVQFVITTHSPFFVKGMKETFCDDCDFLCMPEGHVLNDVVEFSEIEKTIEMFNVNGDQYVEYTKGLKWQLKEISERKDKITVLTEGKTDADFIKKAYEKLGISMPNIEIRGLDEKTDGQTGDKTLKKILSVQKSLNNKLIAIFDRDNPSILDYLNANTSEELTVVDKKVYAFALPIPNHRTKDERISIEHYFSDDELLTEDENGHRLYQAKEFNKNGITVDNSKICKYLVFNREEVDDIYILSGSGDKKVTDLDGDKNYSLSKADFCRNVCNDAEKFNNFNFESFRVIIDKISKIIKMIEL